MNALEPQVYTVSQVNSLIKTTLETSVGLIAVQGEVSGFRNTKERLVYFELKDKESRVLCFMMIWDLKQQLQDGMEIKVYGVPSVFVKSGGLHFRVHEIELVGEGALKRAYELLRKKLEAEGLFAIERKRMLVPFPERIGLITSPDAAAYADVLKVLANRWGGLEIVFIPAGVQGYGAAQSIVKAFHYFNTHEKVDAIILTRGGGSMEDLQAFNDESVARAIFGSRAPVICGVGHERDVTIADFVADVRASTPSNAAECVVPDRNEVAYHINAFTSQLNQAILNQIIEYRHGIASAVNVFERPIREVRHVIHQLVRQMVVIKAQSHEQAMQSLKEAQRLLTSLNPRNVLARGYAIVRKGKKIISTSKGLAAGNIVAVELHEGGFEGTINKVI